MTTTDTSPTVPFLDRQPTMADVIAWVLAVPAIFLGITVCPYMLRVVPRFEGMFKSLNAKLPGVTIFILEHGWWFFTVLPFAVVAGMLWVLLKSDNGSHKVGAAFVAGQIILAIAGTAVVGIFYPILELQKQLT